MRTVGPEDLEALDRALEPSAELVERQVGRALDRPHRQPQRRRRGPVWGLAAAALAVLGLGGLWALRGPPEQVAVPLAPTGAWRDVRPGLAVSGEGQGHLAARRIAWDRGRLVVSLEPGSGPLEVVTDLARVEVTGTVFSVDRGPFGTLVEVSRGSVSVTCTTGRQSPVQAGQAAACTADAPSALALASALDASSHPPQAVLAAVAAGLADPQRPAPVEQSLRGLEVATWLRAQDLGQAARAAELLDPSLPAARQALQKLASASEDCEPVRVALRLLAPDDPAAALRLARCTEDPAEAAQILLQAREKADPETQQALDRWLQALQEP
jgi:ferric-dicitrate binding protein FerR (iron transport regulator)